MKPFIRRKLILYQNRIYESFQPFSQPATTINNKLSKARIDEKRIPVEICRPVCKLAEKTKRTVIFHHTQTLDKILSWKKKKLWSRSSVASLPRVSYLIRKIFQRDSNPRTLLIKVDKKTIISYKIKIVLSFIYRVCIIFELFHKFNLSIGNKYWE